MNKEEKDTSGNQLIEALLEKYRRSREAISGENGLLADLRQYAFDLSRAWATP